MSSVMQPYPPAPWRLIGSAVCAMRWVDTTIARSFVPSGMRMLPLFPGKTLAILYCAQYNRGSTLIYNELIVAPALVYSRGRIGFWISHIYVDDERSMQGGREIWHLPKQLAEFQVGGDANYRVARGKQPLCSIRFTANRRALHLPAVLPAISSGFFYGAGSARLTWGRAAIAIPETSPFHRLGFEHCKRILCARDLRLTIRAPGSPR